jgi:hypothetical protein
MAKTLKDKLISMGRKAAVITLLGGIGAGIFGGCYDYYGSRKVTTMINGTEVKRYNNKDKYLIFTDAGTFEDTDTWIRLKFNSSDVYGEAKKLTGKQAEIKCYGWRSPFMSWYPNVITLNEVKTVAEQPAEASK